MIWSDLILNLLLKQAGPINKSLPLSPTEVFHWRRCALIRLTRKQAFDKLKDLGPVSWVLYELTFSVESGIRLDAFHCSSYTFPPQSTALENPCQKMWGGLRFEPVAAEWEAWMLPLCCPLPFTKSLTVVFLPITFVFLPKSECP